MKSACCKDQSEGCTSADVYTLSYVKCVLKQPKGIPNMDPRREVQPSSVTYSLHLYEENERIFQFALL